MNRRRLLRVAALSGLLAAAVPQVAFAAVVAPPKKTLRIDLRRPAHENPPQAYKYRALLDGIDVSDQCFMADDRLGEVGLYLRNADGAFYPAFLIDPALEGPALEFRKGVVTLIPPD